MKRLPSIDALRGGAVLMMVAYHFCYDTTLFGHTHFRLLEGWGWMAWRDVIVSCFLLLAGVSLVLASQQAYAGFGRRWLQIAAAAALVTVGSMQFFPDGYIYFGILHFVALALLIGRACVPLGRHNLWLGIAVLVAGLTLQSPIFNPKVWSWIGFVSQRPQTEDFVPVFPWLGVVLIGIAIGALWQRRGLVQPAWLARIGTGAPRWLLYCGRHSLLVYLVHQPILFGGFFLLRWLGSTG
ncbi:hypothetical protein IGB42_01511 [Andreprevotia sp. IGB-42]|uniref:heparan-alpha-glucosaminide N-acetyltransferase n=1 Tax=Andreprevotia sp. IGB-42 TaxID=2497473 RepID=UPI001358811B|nr:heparan-alpha-glucosaminide N-acetyltransferase [Andreprevotia sp. IGB-42]KAF0813832.1 hypothetical protein IGB42_01511 [Andreprevotia sp. IGB-42]